MVSNSRLLFALFLTTLLVVPDFTEGLFGIGGGKKDEKKRKDCSELGKQHRCIGASLKCQKPADDGHCGIGKKSVTPNYTLYSIETHFECSGAVPSSVVKRRTAPTALVRARLTAT